MALKNQDDVNRCAEAFFAGNYDFLSGERPDLPSAFYVHLGNWRCVQQDGATVLEQDGSQWGLSVARWFSGIASRTFGRGYQEMLDSIGAFFYFPLAIARDSEVADAVLSALVLPVSGNIDQAGGIAFGIRNIANYFVFRVNPLEENAMIYEYVNGERLQRATVDLDLPTGQWYDLRIRIAGQNITALLNGRQILEYAAATPVAGHVGLWSKADAVIRFGPLSIEHAGGVRTFGCQPSANNT
jgi:pyruvate,water dikinase